MGFRTICYVANEIIVSGMRMALPGELKSMKMLVDKPHQTDLPSPILNNIGVKDVSHDIRGI